MRELGKGYARVTGQICESCRRDMRELCEIYMSVMQELQETYARVI